MLRRFLDSVRTSKERSVATAFHRLGWTGLSIQVVVGALSTVLLAYLLVFSRSPTGSRAGLRFVEYLTMAGLIVLAFTALWSYRYTLLAQRIADPRTRPARSSVIWNGLDGARREQSRDRLLDPGTPDRVRSASNRGALGELFTPILNGQHRREKVDISTKHDNRADCWRRAAPPVERAAVLPAKRTRR